ncbi:sporulation protein YunB [Cytobacillus oceanisediminis]|uniref:Sporulation protein YunB n=1 Tax=Cytobacillus oceanisediminis TaxID=665099 RepID=A0A2V2ZZT6_9BACI|nr:sporulation protein YunB [Cytobacillus oceanisediminis]PWW29658.1 sporulation protein YunB [Cytobacillus oceanisediminis]TWH89963.1 sporulation protein YunB [Cytobacillus oceanisediminis]
MAKFRGRLPRKGPLPFRYVFLLTFVFFVFSTAAGLWIINEGLKPTLMSYADSQTRKIASLVINNAINKKITNVMDLEDMFEASESGVVSINVEKLNRVKAEVTELVQDNIKKAEKGDLDALESFTDVEINTEQKQSSNGIVYYVPLGQATNNALLGNLGPRIPVKFNAVGSVTSNFITETKDHGINNVEVKVLVRLDVQVQIIIPFATKIITVQEDVLAAYGIYPGKVPQFYNGGGDTSPSIEVPAGQ